MPERFPKPWRVEELAACYVVRDAHGVPLGYVYWQTGEAGASAVERPSKEQALVLAKAFAKLGAHSGAVD